MFESLLKKIAGYCDRHGLLYMVIGGQAVLLYGSPRLTRGIDITLGIDSDRFELVEQLCRELKLEMLPPDPKGFAGETKVLPVRDPATEIRIDFIFSFTPYERQALKRVKGVVLDNQKINFAAVEDVIVHKMLADRAVDRQDIEAIILRQKKLIDFPYIEKWLKEFSKLNEYKAVLERFKAVVKTLL